MKGLLVFKERLKAFYGKNSAFVIPVLKFVVAFTAIFLINRNAGFMPKISGSLVPGLIIAILLSAAVAGVYHFFVFAVDYSRTEFVQFEDDDYYYYVKAVPKIAVTKPDVKVQKINTRRTPRQK